MKENDRLLAKLLALLLEYPDRAWREAVRDAAEVTVHIENERQRQMVGEFLAYCQSTSIMTLQQEYTRTFDLEPSTSLNLSYHLTGDSEDRGRMLARLVWEYSRQGFEPTVSELPDYLPMMLEFFSLCRRPDEAVLLRHCLGTITPLARRLAEQHRLYGVLLTLAAEVSDGMGSPLPPLASEK